MKTRDPRVEHTHKVVIQAAVDLLVEEGFERITIDRVAERSGVARSTIYRNWSDRPHLLMDAFRSVCPTSEPPDTGSLAGDLRELGLELAHGLAAEQWGSMIVSLTGAAGHDPRLREAHLEFSEGRRARLRTVMGQALARGELSPEADVETAMPRFIGALFHRKLFTDEPLDEAFVQRLVDATVRELTGSPPAA